MKHMMKLRGGQRGQALLLVTLSLFAMCGLLGLAVDLGWSYYIQKSAQNAADSAALSAAHQALCGLGSSSSCGSPPAPGETVPITCGNVNCQPATACAAGTSNNLSSGCFFAQQNGFTPGGNGGRQNVTIAADLGPVTRYQDGTSVPPVPSCAAGSGVLVGCVEYRVTVRTVEAIPQLFSAVLGNTTAVPSARATAAVIQTLVNGSLITLSRADIIGPSGTPTPITAPNGMVVSGPLPTPVPAVSGPIFIPSSVSNPSSGSANTFSILPDGPQFLDPMRGYGQPPLPTTPLTTYAVMQGILASYIFPVQGFNVVGPALPLASALAPLPSGIYFSAVCATGCANSIPSTISPQVGALTIGPGGIVPFSNGAFGNFVFLGGLNVQGQMQMGPGEYVIVGGAAGSLQVSGNNAGITATSSGNAGEIIILTGSSSAFTFNSNGTAITGNANGDLYPGLMTLMNGSSTPNLALMELASLNGALAFGPANIQTSFGTVDSANPTGLDPTSAVVQSSGLQPFGGIVLWQDQANSTIDYTTPINTPASLPGWGYVDIYNCGSRTMATPCARTLANPNSPGLNVQTPNTLGLTGTVYQPRGAWINVGPGIFDGYLQVITGSVVSSAGSGSMNLKPLPANLVNLRLRRRVVALIE
jgi:Flp pilus assembly protein TadG